MRASMWPIALLKSLLPMLAVAQSSSEQTCRDTATETAARTAACEAFVAEAEDDGARARAHVYLARSYRDAESFDAALAAAGQALALRPDYDFALGEKGVILNKLDRHSDALDVFDQLIAIEPDDPWNQYYRGVVLRAKLDFEGALDSYDAALALDPDYYWALLGRARVLHRLAPWEQAGEAYDKVLAQEPLDAGINSDAGWAFRQAEMPDRAAYYYRITLTLSPNRLETRQWLDAYIGEPKVPLLDDLPWREPPIDRNLMYLRVHAPVDTRDEMEVAIEELFSFFGGSPRPVPLGSSVFEARIAEIDGDTLDWRRRTTHTSGEDIPAQPPAGMFRGVFSSKFRPLGPKAPPVAARFGDRSPTEVWPLRVGNTASGEGEFRTICPDQPTIPGRLLGCVDELDATRRGAFSWTLTVDRTERVHVPMGFFDCFVLHYTQEGSFAPLMAKPKPLNQDVWVWYAPELDTFVRREVILGETFILDQALGFGERKDAP